MVFRWRADDDPTLNAGLVALRFFRGSGPLLLENPIFCDFSGGARPPCPPLDPHMSWVNPLEAIMVVMKS